MRILLYATNGLGLGHVTRLLSISRALRKKGPSHEILFLTRCEAGPYPYPEDPFTIRIPGISRAKASGLTPKSYYQATQPLLWQTIASFDPHLLVTDTFPDGPEGELAPIMRWPIRKAFIYRDSRPESFLKEELRDKLAPYQIILVAHEEGSITLPAFLERDPRVHFTGTIMDPLTGHTRQEMRDRLGFSEKKVVLVTLGGGGDPEISTVLGLVLGQLRTMDVEIHVATGPLMRGIPEGVTAREWFPAWPLAPFLSAFDCAVAGGGYNTVNELSAAALPSLLIPFDRALDDQMKRILHAEKSGWALAARNRSPEALRDGLVRLFSSPFLLRNPTSPPMMEPSGALKAADLLLSLTGSHRSHAGPSTGHSRENSHVLVP